MTGQHFSAACQSEIPGYPRFTLRQLGRINPRKGGNFQAIFDYRASLLKLLQCDPCVLEADQ
jgi:hypothetical protein